MRLFFDKGWLIEAREIADYGVPYTKKAGEAYIQLLAFQVFDEAGAPTQMSYRGPGEIRPPKIFIGDPQKTTNLLEGTVASQATSESWDHYRGFETAIKAPRLLTDKQLREKSYNQSEAWRDGYRAGYAERKMYGVKKPAAY